VVQGGNEDRELVNPMIMQAIKHKIRMGLHGFNHNRLEKILKSELKPAYAVMDIGCGVRPQPYLIPKVHYCIDPYPEYLNKLEKPDDRDWAIVMGDWKTATFMMSYIPTDTVFLLDVIEHIDYLKAKVYLKRTEKLVKKQIVVFTPDGYLEQETREDGKDAWGLDGADFQDHLSGWKAKDFGGEGWKVWRFPFFHTANNLNEPIRPQGAILAIYTKEDEDGTKTQ